MNFVFKAEIIGASLPSRVHPSKIGPSNASESPNNRSAILVSFVTVSFAPGEVYYEFDSTDARILIESVPCSFSNSVVWQREGVWLILPALVTSAGRKSPRLGSGIATSGR